MLRYILIIAMGLMAAGMFAQIGLLDLSFGQSYQDAERILLDQGFVKLSNNGKTVEFVPRKSTQVSGMLVYVNPSDQKLVGWMIAFKSDPVVDLKKGVLGILNNMHGQHEYFSVLDAYIWNLDESRQIVSYTDKSQDGFQVLYMDSRYEKYF